MIAEEMIRIDVDLANDAAQAELDHAPVVSGHSAAARFPAVHPFAAVGKFVGNENTAPRFQQIFLLREKFIVRDQRSAADAFRCKIDKTWRHRTSWISRAHATTRLAAAISTVAPRRDQKRHMIFRRCVRDIEAHRYMIEKF